MVLINIRILLTTGLVWPASCDKCKAPLEYKKYTFSGNMKLHIMQLTNFMGKLPFTSYMCRGLFSEEASLWFDSRPPTPCNHKAFAFRMDAYRSFDCI